jgi:hypothetical protein
VGLNEAYPLLTSRQSWLTSSNENATQFPIPGNWTMLQDSASFLVSVGGVLQAPANYTINSATRTLTFSEVVSSGLEVGVTQLATAAPSTAYFDTISASNSFFVNLTAFNINAQTVNGALLTAINLITTNLSALTAVIDNLDIRLTELSGFVVNGSIQVSQGLTANNIFALTALNVLSQTVYSTVQRLSVDRISVANLSADNFYINNLVTNTGTIANATYNTLSTINLSAQNLFLNNVYGQDIIGNITTLVFPSTSVKVGLGTTQPNKTLTVIGSISTTELNAKFINTDTLEFTTAFGPYLPEYHVLTSDTSLGVVGSGNWSIFYDNLPILLPNKQYLLDYYVSYSYTRFPNTQDTTIVWNLSTIPNTNPAWNITAGDITHSTQTPTTPPTIFVVPLSSNQSLQLSLQPYTVARNPNRHYFKASLMLALTSSDTDAREINLGMRMGAFDVTSFVVHRGSYWRLTQM